MAPPGSIEEQRNLYSIHNKEEEEHNAPSANGTTWFDRIAEKLIAYPQRKK
jgi:hypothetical protein